MRESPQGFKYLLRLFVFSLVRDQKNINCISSGPAEPVVSAAAVDGAAELCGFSHHESDGLIEALEVGGGSV